MSSLPAVHIYLMEDINAVVAAQAPVRGQGKKWRVTKLSMIVSCHDVIFLMSSEVLIKNFLISNFRKCLRGVRQKQSSL
jgi:hypothetical protein